MAPTVSPIPELSTLPSVSPEVKPNEQPNGMKGVQEESTKPPVATNGTVNADVKVGSDLIQGNGGTSPAPVTVELTMNMDSGNFYFRPNTIAAKLNQPVTIKFNNSGFHTFTIDELGVNQTLSGSLSSFTFTPNKKGTFEFYCTVGNHRDLGQKGTITVE